MPRFFVRSSQIESGIVTITGDDAHHISRALRMAAGEHITVCDMQSHEYDCRLTAFLPDRVCAEVLSVRERATEPPVHLVLYQALPKGEKLDTVIQKAVECGVSRVVPFVSERCVAKEKPETEARKTERRARIALEAAKQCGRGVVPTVSAALSFRDMLAAAKTADVCFFCYEGDGTEPLGRLLAAHRPPNGAEVALVVGSEGGFSLSEAAAAREAGFLMTGLGPRILRTETAPLFALAAISCAWELS